MKTFATWVAGITIALACNGAGAAFIMSALRIPGTGANAGYDIVKIFAFNNGLPNSGTRVQSIDMTFTNTGADGFSTTAPLRFYFRDVDGDGSVDFDFYGMVPASAANPLGTYIRVGTTAAFNVASSTPIIGFGNPGNDPNFRTNHTFQLGGFSATPPLANTGAGAQIAAAVLPTGDILQAVGLIASERSGDVGGIASFSLTVLAPEPSSLTLLAVAFCGLMRRGRVFRGG